MLITSGVRNDLVGAWNTVAFQQSCYLLPYSGAMITFFDGVVVTVCRFSTV